MWWNVGPRTSGLPKDQTLAPPAQGSLPPLPDSGSGCLLSYPCTPLPPTSTPAPHLARQSLWVRTQLLPPKTPCVGLTLPFSCCPTSLLLLTINWVKLRPFVPFALALLSPLQSLGHSLPLSLESGPLSGGGEARGEGEQGREDPCTGTETSEQLLTCNLHEAPPGLTLVHAGASAEP